MPIKTPATPDHDQASRRTRGFKLAVFPGGRLAAPPLAFLAIFFVVPFLLLLMMSFLKGGGFRYEWAWNIGNYIRFLGAFGFWRIVLNGMENGFFTASICVCICFPVAWHITYRSRSNILLYAVLVSMFSSYLVRIYAWRTILGTNGVINSFLIDTGIIKAPLPWLLFSPFASILALVHIMTPFALLVLVSALQDVKREYTDAARDLGAPYRALIPKVVIPMAYKGIVGAFMVTFILAAGDFVVPQTLGGLHGVTAGLLISNQFRTVGNWPFGAAMAFVSLLTFVAVYFAFTGFLRLLHLAPGRRYHR